MQDGADWYFYVLNLIKLNLSPSFQQSHLSSIHLLLLSSLLCLKLPPLAYLSAEDLHPISLGNWMQLCLCVLPTSGAQMSGPELEPTILFPNLGAAPGIPSLSPPFTNISLLGHLHL